MGLTMNSSLTHRLISIVTSQSRSTGETRPIPTVASLPKVTSYLLLTISAFHATFVAVVVLSHLLAGPVGILDPVTQVSVHPNYGSIVHGLSPGRYIK